MMFQAITSPIQTISDVSIENEYHQYLQEAIDRNSPPVQKYSVIWHRKDFVELEDTHSSYFTATQEIKPSEDAHNGFHASSQSDSGKLGLNSSFPRATISAGLSGTSGATGGNGNTSCEGLIFDPCIYLDDPTPARGGMYFGSDRI